MTTWRVHVDGVGLWSPQLADFPALRTVLAGGTPAPPSARPSAATLPPNERRRAPESVLLAVEVAGQAVAMSGHDAATLACVFSSSHGDQSITDYMCATLAQAPAELSPIRFHNSVHNAPVGYWTIATGCHAPSTAVCAHEASFGAGLLEAVTQVMTEQQPVLLVCSDTQRSGPLGEMTGCEQPFGCALLLSPHASAATLAHLDLQITATQTETALPAPLDEWRASSPSGAGLILFNLLAAGGGLCRLTAAGGVGLQLDVELELAT